MDPSKRYLQRAEWHDYTSRCSYLVTVRSNPVIGRLSDIVAKKTSIDYTARWIPSPAGKIAMTAVRNINNWFPWVDVMRYSIMPDHVHLLLFVKEKTDVHLGTIVKKFETECTLDYNSQINPGMPDLEQIPFYLYGYNDKIVFRKNQLNTFKRYVEDNPRRYALRRDHPEYFDRCQNIKIDGVYFTVYGNFLLLRHPMIASIRISRSFSEEELESRRKVWNETMRTQGVLVSPFYSPKEKEVRDEAIECGAKIIRIEANGLPERFKPSGKEFELCNEGRLLIIAPAEYQTRKVSLTRDMCMYGNHVAERIAQGAIALRLLRGNKKH